MSRKLAVTVYVQREDGEIVRCLAGSTPASEDAKLITNPNVWDDGEPDAEPEPEPVDGGKPPKAGKGSGVEAWKAYADAQGVTVDEKASRDDIIAAVEKREGNPRE